MNTYHVYTARMNLALHASSALERFEHSNAIEIHNRIMFDFYPGLPHVCIQMWAWSTSRRSIVSWMSGMPKHDLLVCTQEFALCGYTIMIKLTVLVHTYVYTYSTWLALSVGCVLSLECESSGNTLVKPNNMLLCTALPGSPLNVAQFH